MAAHMDLNNEVHGDRLTQHTTTNPKTRVGLLPSHGGERCRGVGEGGEETRGDFVSDSPSNLPQVVACNLSISLFFFISISIHHEIKFHEVYIYSRF
jgi:hypothetical protein